MIYWQYQVVCSILGLEEWLRVGWSIDKESFSEAVEVLETVISKAMDIT